jgi:hypothetical protein
MPHLKVEIWGTRFCGLSDLLAVGGFGSVFAEVVAVEEGLGDSYVIGYEGEGVVSHLCYGFEDYGVVGGGVGVTAPAEGGVAVDEAGWDGDGVDSMLLEVIDDGEAGLVDVAAGDGFIVQGCGAGDGAVEVVGVGGAEGWDGEAGLGEAGGELGVGVDDGADGGELAVEEGVGVEVGGGFEFAVDDLAVEVGDDHEFGDEFVVVDAGGLDDDEALFAVDAAGVAEGVEDEATLDEFEVGFEDLGAKFFEEHGFLRLEARVNVFQELCGAGRVCGFLHCAERGGTVRGARKGVDKVMLCRVMRR